MVEALSITTPEMKNAYDSQNSLRSDGAYLRHERGFGKVLQVVH
jgi:hypothetical protein